MSSMKQKAKDKRVEAHKSGSEMKVRYAARDKFNVKSNDVATMRVGGE